MIKKNYYIIFDTNVVWGKPFQKVFLEFKDYVASTGLKIGLYLPETVKEEFKKKTLFELREVAEKHNSAVIALKKFNYLNLQNTKAFSIDENLVKQKLDDLLVKSGFEIIPVPYDQIDLEKILEQAVYYLPPFERNEKGFKDSIIAETIVAATKSFDDNATRIFVSNDSKLRGYVASLDKGLLTYESIKDLESRLRADIQHIGNIEEFINQADELLYVELHGVSFFGHKNDFRSLLHEKFPNLLNGYTISYDTTDPLPETEKRLSKTVPIGGEALKIRGNPFFVKKEGNVFFWESGVALSRNFQIPTSESDLSNEKIEYDLDFVIRWKTVEGDSKLMAPELMEIKYFGHTVTKDLGKILPGITAFNIYPSKAVRQEITYH
jgi:hypothetical protein